MTVALSRRTLLRGAGAAVALPLLDAMPAQAAPPVRMVTFFWANGTRGSLWAPSSPTLSPSTLGACMRDAFAPAAGKPDVIPYLNVVTGLGANDVWKSGHSCAMMACGYGGSDDHNNYGNWPTAATLDQILAARFGGATRLPSLAVAPYKPYADLPGWAYVSWKEGGMPIPPYRNPKEVFSLLLSGGSSQGAANTAALRTAARRKSLLDFVREDARALQLRLGLADRARVEEHLNSVRELERLLMTPAAGAACAPTDPTSLPADEAFLKLIVLALKCDQTRYASYMLDTASGQRSYPGDAGGDHDLSHNGDDARIIRRTNIKLGYLARFLQDLAAIPEGSATLLDNALVYSVSDVADGKAHGREGLPVIVAGRAGGALKSGRHIAAAKKRLVDLHCSLLNYGGVPTDRYGTGGTGPLVGF